MNRIKKNIRRLTTTIVILIAIIVVVGEVSIRIRINFSSEGVSKAIFSNSYFIKAEGYDEKIDSFKKYMLKEGWDFSENYNEKIIFRKGNLQKEVPIEDLINI